MKVALAEVNSILENSEEEITKKIPDKFKEYVKTNMDKEYIPNVIPGLAIFAQPVSLEAKELLRLVYRDFLANKQERDILIKKENEILKVENSKENLDVTQGKLIIGLNTPIEDKAAISIYNAILGS